MKKLNLRLLAKTVGIELAGSFLIAIGIYNFALHAEFPMTGFSGVALILNRFFHLPVGATILLLNVPVALLCYRMLGRGFFLRSLRCMFLSSVMIDYIAPLLPVYQGERWLAAICTGVLAGIGYAVIYMQNSSTGGSDFIVMAVKAARPHITLGKISFLADLGVVLVGGILFRDVDGIIYGLVINYLFAVAADKVMYGINAGKVALVVTTMGEDIAKVIEKCCDRGSTILPALGGYQGEERQMVMCACNNKQMYALQKAVKEADPASFTVILESNEVHGEGFHTLQIGEKNAGPS